VPVRLTKEERLRRLVDKQRRRIDASREAPKSLSHAPDSKLGVLVREAGYKRIPPKFLEEFDRELRAVAIATYPNLTDPSNNRETRIYFFDSGNRISGLQDSRELFASEKELMRFMCTNWAVLPYVRKADLRIRRSEARIADDCVIDLLAEDKKSGELVGIELKVGKADDRLVRQAAKYMRALKAQAKSEGRQGARLMIVTGQPDESLAEDVQIHAEKSGVKTEWLLYRVSFGVSPVS
jgi:hypothetical protein